MIKNFEYFINEEYDFKKESNCYDLKVGDFVKFGESIKKGGWQGHEKKEILMNKIGKIICIKNGFAMLPSCDEIGVEFFEQIGDKRHYNCEGRGKNGYCMFLNGRWLTKIDFDDIDEDTKDLILKYEETKNKIKLKKIEIDPFSEENWEDE